MTGTNVGLPEPQSKILRSAGEQPMERVDMAQQHGFAQDPKKAAEAGRKGGEHGHDRQQAQSHSERSQQGSRYARSGGSGNFANDRERAAEAGRKGGKH